MEAFEIKNPDHIGRDKRSPWASRIAMQAISQEISEIDGRSPESVYELLRTVFHTGKILPSWEITPSCMLTMVRAHPGWNLPKWRQEAPISFRRITRLQAIEKSLDDINKKIMYEGGVEAGPATEPWQLVFQRCEESRKNYNEHVRANYNGLDIDGRNSKIEWQKDYGTVEDKENRAIGRDGEKRAKERNVTDVKKEASRIVFQISKRLWRTSSYSRTTITKSKTTVMSRKESQSCCNVSSCHERLLANPPSVGCSDLSPLLQGACVAVGGTGNIIL